MTNISKIKPTDFNKNILGNNFDTGVEEQLGIIVVTLKDILDKLPRMDGTRRTGYVKRVNEVADSVNDLAGYMDK